MTYDVDTERARRAEAAGGTHWDFTLGGETYLLPREIPYEIAEKLEALDGNSPTLIVMRTAMQDLLGKEQAKRFPFGPLSLPDYEGIFEAYFTAMGAGLGESRGSSASSATTATPSKRTSKRSTASRSRTSTPAR